MILAITFMEKWRFSPLKCILNQIWICRKVVKVNPESSFVQNWYGPHPQCYTPSPKAIGLLVLEKIFKGFLPYIGILVMWLKPFFYFIPSSYEIWVQLVWWFLRKYVLMGIEHEWPQLKYQLWPLGLIIVIASSEAGSTMWELAGARCSGTHLES